MNQSERKRNTISLQSSPHISNFRTLFDPIMSSSYWNYKLASGTVGMYSMLSIDALLPAIPSACRLWILEILYRVLLTQCRLHLHCMLT